MKNLSGALLIVIRLFSIAVSAQLGQPLSGNQRVKRGIFGAAFGFGFKSSILESKFGKGGFPFPFAPVQPAAQPGDVPAAQPDTLPAAQPGTLPAAQPTAQPVAPMIPTFLLNIISAKQNIITSKIAAKQAPDGTFVNPLPENLTLEDVELAEAYVDPATATRNDILESIFKLSSSLSVNNGN